MRVNNQLQLDLIFKALSDKRRRKILEMLTNAPLTTGYICQEFTELNRCTVMQHLGVLEKAGLIRVERQGKFRLNYLDKSPFNQVNDFFMSKNFI